MLRQKCCVLVVFTLFQNKSVRIFAAGDFVLSGWSQPELHLRLLSVLSAKGTASPSLQKSVPVCCAVRNFGETALRPDQLAARRVTVTVSKSSPFQLPDFVPLLRLHECIQTFLHGHIPMFHEPADISIVGLHLHGCVLRPGRVTFCSGAMFFLPLFQSRHRLSLFSVSYQPPRIHLILCRRYYRFGIWPFCACRYCQTG